MDAGAAALAAALDAGVVALVTVGDGRCSAAAARRSRVGSRGGRLHGTSLRKPGRSSLEAAPTTGSALAGLVPVGAVFLSGNAWASWPATAWEPSVDWGEAVAPGWGWADKPRLLARAAPEPSTLGEGFRERGGTFSPVYLTDIAGGEVSYMMAAARWRDGGTMLR